MCPGLQRPKAQSLPRKISRFVALLDQLLKQHLTELAQLGPRQPGAGVFLNGAGAVFFYSFGVSFSAVLKLKHLSGFGL